MSRAYMTTFASLIQYKKSRIGTDPQPHMTWPFMIRHFPNIGLGLLKQGTAGFLHAGCLVPGPLTLPRHA